MATCPKCEETGKSKFLIDEWGLCADCFGDYCREQTERWLADE